MEELETLLKIAGKEPYLGRDYSIKRRQLTKKLKDLLRTHLREEAEVIIRIFESRRGFTISDQLLKYSSKSFERIVDGIVEVCCSVVEMNKYEKNELKKDIIKAVIEVKRS